MKILFMSYAESHSIKWVNALALRGFQILFVMQKSVVNEVDKLDKSVKVVQLPIKGKKGYYLNFPFLKNIIKKYQPDVINVHFASGYGTMIRLSNAKKVILSVWGSDVYDFPYKSNLCMNIIRKNLLSANQIASTSFCMAEQVRRLIGDTKQITVTPFGVDVEKFKCTGYKRDEEKIVIGNVKVLAPKYGIDDLVKAVALLIKDLSKTEYAFLANKVYCYIYGDGEQKDELNRLIKSVNLEEKVILKGKIEHSKVPEVLNDMDIFCATSVLDSESFGVSVVEAQAVELPVVVTDVDGFKEVVDDGITGYIVRRKNIGEIAEALKRLVIDKNMRKKMGENGRRKVLQKYNFNQNVNQMEELYIRVSQSSDE